MAPFASDSTTLRYCLFYARPCQAPADATWRERTASDVARLEVKIGSHAWRGFFIGTASCGMLLALTSPLIGWPDWTDNPANFLLDFAGGAVASVPVCGGVGAMIGGQSPRWGPPPD